jgi:hypothetical protein
VASAAFVELGQGSLEPRVGGASADRIGDHRQEVVVAPEVSEVREREVDGVGDGPGAAQRSELGLLAVAS